MQRGASLAQSCERLPSHNRIEGNVRHDVVDADDEHGIVSSPPRPTSTAKCLSLLCYHCVLVDEANQRAGWHFSKTRNTILGSGDSKAALECLHSSAKPDRAPGRI